MRPPILLAALAAVAAAPAAAAPSPGAPKLIVAISIDQFSADLFAEYRPMWTAGMKRLATGAVFPAGYQSHAATETCPGHSTILTGDHPARTGIIANTWFDMRSPRADKRVYCAEDETVPGSTVDDYTVSDRHLRVPTLGDRMKAADPRSRVVAVSGKDRAAVMMGGHHADEIWWFGARGFVSFAGRPVPATVGAVNAAAGAQFARPTAIALPPACRRFVAPVALTAKKSVGAAPPAPAAGDLRGFRASPAIDADTLALAEGLLGDMKLGAGPAPDLLAISLSATDYVGHSYGTQGPEMCAQLMTLDVALGTLLDRLDRTRVPYLVMLTADHGGLDLSERSDRRAAPDAQRVDPALMPAAMGRSVAAALGLGALALTGDGPFGDIYLPPELAGADRRRVLAAAKARYAAHPQVAAVFTGAELAATPKPTRPADEWSLAERAAASYDLARSGDLIVLLKPHVTPIADPGPGYVATHGSPWNYDRRVPILFYRPGMTGFEQPLPVETVDILPTLAATIGLAVPQGEVDGRCLDLDAGERDSCAP